MLNIANFWLSSILWVPSSSPNPVFLNLSRYSFSGETEHPLLSSQFLSTANLNTGINLLPMNSMSLTGLVPVTAADTA